MPSRWRSASFDVPARGWVLKIVNTLEQASALWHLHLHLQDPPYALYLEGEFPMELKALARLRTLSVSMGLISFPTSAPSGLLSLQLTRMPSSLGHLSYEWLAMLAACPRLVELELTEGLNLLVAEEPILESKIELGLLITMILRCSAPLMAFILDSLSTPNCQTFHITLSPTSKWRDDPEADLYRVLMQHVAAHAHRVVEASQEDVIIVSKSRTLYMRSSTSSSKETHKVAYLGVTVLGYYEVTNEPLLMLKDVFCDSSSLPRRTTITLVEDATDSAHLSIPGLNLRRDKLLQCISSWPGVHTICCSLAQKSVPIEDILYFLAQPSHHAGLPCPNLRELIFDCEIPLRMAGSFAGFILDRHANQILQREDVARLETIRIGGSFDTSRDEVASLKVALEETGVSWQEGVEMDERRFGMDLLQFTPRLRL